MSVTLICLATLLSPYFFEVGKTITAESVKLALEKREDIKNAFLNIFQPEEFISLGLSEYQKPEEVKALLEADTPTAGAIRRKIESNRALIDELAKILSQQEGITITAKNIAAAGNVTITNQTNNFS